MKKLLGLFILFVVSYIGVVALITFLSPNVAFALPEHFSKRTLGSGFDQPTDIAETPDNRILVLEKNGTVKVIQNGQTLPTPLMCGTKTNGCPVKLNVDVYQERGALGMTLDPDFGSNHYFYIIYTNASPLEYHISRFTEANNQAVAGSEVILHKLSANPNAGTHIGGGLRFGPDGKLWFTVGDNTLDATHEPQKLTSPYGKLHRINVDGTIPSDNPFVGQSGVVESIWAYGLRNPFRFSFTPDGSPIIGDVGGSLYEEVNIGVKGANYGWPICEGPCSQAGFTNPSFSYPHTASSSASISGGFVYTGNQFPAEYKGKYFFGDYVRGYIHALDLNGSTLSNEISIDDQAGAAINFIQANDGSIYFVDIFPNGEVNQLYYSTENQPPVAKIAADKTSGPTPLTVQFSSANSTDPENDNLTYKWNFGDGATSTEANPSHIYTVKGNFDVTLVVNDGHAESQPAIQKIAAGNNAPIITIVKPTEGLNYNAGDTLNYSATATDQEDGDLPASAYVWTFIFHHSTHTHPFKAVSGVKSGSVILPNNGESSPDVWYEVSLTVTDSTGLKSTVSRSVHPNLATITVNSSPLEGMVINVEGIPFATPYTTQVVVGYDLHLEAQSPLFRDGKTYTFDSWSDGGTQLHDVIIPEGNTIYKVNYKTDNNPVNTQKAYTIIVGDVKVDGTELYDSDERTGLVVVLEKDSQVEAPWGATFIPNSDLNSANQNALAIVGSLRTQGCGSGCTDVKLVHWPSEKPEEKIITMLPGEKKQVAANSVVIGDVKINGEAMYDDESASGLLILMEKASEVEAQWGAQIITNKSLEEGEDALQRQSAETKDNGCGSHCVAVIIGRWPSSPPENKIQEMKAGEKKLLPKFSVISGDIRINGKDIFDNNETTGLVTQLEEEAEVESPFGATYNVNYNSLSASIAAQILEQKVKDYGCVGGCQTVSVLSWPQQVMQKVEAFLHQVVSGMS